jgi:hypothetical protein
MMKKIKHKFVEFIPTTIEPDTLYISTEYKTAIHMCSCGCGNEVATSISPYDWELTFNGESVSLYPSIGSWGLPCQSHYWIKNGEVKWAPKWSRGQIEHGRKEAKNKRRSVLDFLKW